MKSILMVIVLLTAGLSFAASENVSSLKMDSDSEVSANILKGHMQVGGGFNYRQSSPSNGELNSNYGIYPQVEYFVIDHLSLGGTLNFFGQNGSTTYTGYGIGPSLSYYFYQRNSIATYVG